MTQDTDAFLGLKSKAANVCAGWIGLVKKHREKVGETSETRAVAPTKKGRERLKMSRSACRKKHPAFTWMDNNRNQLY